MSKSEFQNRKAIPTDEDLCNLEIMTEEEFDRLRARKLHPETEVSIRKCMNSQRVHCDLRSGRDPRGEIVYKREYKDKKLGISEVFAIEASGMIHIKTTKKVDGIRRVSSSYMTPAAYAQKMNIEAQKRAKAKRRLRVSQQQPRSNSRGRNPRSSGTKRRGSKRVTITARRQSAARDPGGGDESG